MELTFMHNFYIDKLGKVDDEVLLATSEAKHLFKTLRAAKGDTIALLDGQGGSAEAEIIEGKKIIIKSVEDHAEPQVKIHLFVAVPKRTKMDQLLRQCTEAGVWAVHPIITKFSVAVPDKISERWNTLLQEACKQAGNMFVPKLYPPCSLSEALNEIKYAKMSAFYGSVSQNEEEKACSSNPEIAWLVGPEGGFSDDEEQQMLSSGVVPLNIGPYIMRVETAAVCGVSLLNFCNKDISF
jgi:16S rRNA (uracil1498-N3)-methyltransferase